MSIGNKIYAELKGDKVIWMIIALLSMLSILIVYSSTGTLAFKNRGGNTESYLFKHVVILGVGLLLTYLCYAMHYLRFRQAAPWLILVAVPLLIFTIAMGSNINSARRWIEIPFIGLSFQTSDFAKLALIIFVAREVSKHKDYIKDFKKAFMPIIVPILIVCFLIAPADLSTALMLFLTTGIMMFVARVDLKYIILLFFLGVVIFAFLILIHKYAPDFVRLETWVSRISQFMDSSEVGYQVEQSKMAISNGALLGQGPGNSVMRNYLPSPYSDFVYATIIEEYGLVGGFVVLFLYILLFLRVVRLITKSKKAFGAMVALGLSLNLILQALINMAVSVDLVPVTGLPLPLVSMGGTSILFTCISLGIILSVSKFMESISNTEAQTQTSS